METFLGTDLSLLGIVMAGMTLLWLVSLARREASIVDVFWGQSTRGRPSRLLRQGTGWGGEAAPNHDGPHKANASEEDFILEKQ